MSEIQISKKELSREEYLILRAKALVAREIVDSILQQVKESPADSLEFRKAVASIRGNINFLVDILEITGKVWGE